MTKTIRCICSLAILLAVSFSAAGATKIKIATVTPEGSSWMREMRAAAAEIKQRTEGRVVVKYYGGGVMGNDKKVLRKMRIGQLQGGAFTAGGLVDHYPDIVLYTLPLIFNSQQEVDYVRQRMDAGLVDGLDQAGLVTFGFAGGGFGNLMADRPVERNDDLRGQKVWVPEGDTISIKGLEALDLLPVALPITDVLTGLQTGLLDAIVAPPIGAVVLQWYTKVSFVTELPITYTMALLAIDKRVFGKLSAADQKVFREVMTAVYDGFDQSNRADNASARQALKNNGIEFVRLDQPTVDRWRRAAADVNYSMADAGVFSASLLRELQGYLEEFRSSDGAHAAVSTELFE